VALARKKAKAHTKEKLSAEFSVLVVIRLLSGVLSRRKNQFKVPVHAQHPWKNVVSGRFVYFTL
jgi:hypothetical protein